MSALHVVVRPRPEHAPNSSLAPLYGLFDVVVDGINITARIGEGEAVTLLAELAEATASLSNGRRTRQTLQLVAAQEVWELGLEADGPDTLLSVFRSRPSARVAVFERRVARDALRRAVEVALQDLETDGTGAERTGSAARGSLLSARRALSTLTNSVSTPRKMRSVLIRETGSARLRLGAQADLRLRAAATTPAKSRIERSDLHALLCAGSLLFEIHGQELKIPGSHLFLDAERLLALVEEIIESVAARRPIFRRPLLTGALLSLRWSPETNLVELRVKRNTSDAARERTLFTELDARDFCTSACNFALALGAEIVRCDADQAHNLRLQALSKQAEALLDRLSDHPEDETIENPHPQSYRCFAPKRGSRRKGVWDHGGKMRFVPRWVATVPNIDLSATFLCGDRLVVGSLRETACIERQAGNIVWRRRTPPAKTVVSPSGLLRIEPDGRLSCHSLEDGEVRFEVALAPRPGAGPTGSVVDTAGLPRLLAISEGDRQVTAIDLASGDVRWRYTGLRSAQFRLRRAGKLMLVGGGDPTLVALDVSSGEVVWRLRERLPFTGDFALDRDSIFTLSGAAGGQWVLHHVEAWTGKIQWSTEIEDRPLLGRIPLVTPDVIVVPTRDDQGCGARGYDRQTGRLLWEHATGLVAPTTAFLVVDGLVIANSAAGVLLCLDAATGTPVYNHVFAKNLDASQPRRLEPVLRSGALFVPQHEVHVVRPRDGEILGTLPSDLIPDLIRVDERCDVYVAEESGHLAAFGAATRLALVKPAKAG